MTYDRVIFRKEYNIRTKLWKYIAIFPDYPAGLGQWLCVPFYKKKDQWIFEEQMEAEWDYLYNCKTVYKKDPIIPELIQALKDYCDNGIEFKVLEYLVK